LLEPFRFAALAQKAADVCMPVGKQTLDNMGTQKPTCAGNQDLQANTSG
jgi:hypothetical protein